MSLIAASQLTAAATAILALFAVITAVFAFLAFRKQSAEVSTLERQATDQQELTRQQGELLQVQARQLELQQQQLDEQRKVNDREADVAEVQLQELRESLAERKTEAERQRQEQASMVAAWFAVEEVHVVRTGTGSGPPTRPAWGAIIRNNSDLPILGVRVFFHFISADNPASEHWEPIMRGGPPERIRVIPPRHDKFVEIPATVRNMIHECSDEIYVVSIEFTDAAGNRWERDARGALKAL
jgi:hypothetical protein